MTNRRRILVVEDKDDLLSALAALLTNHEVRSARDGLQALLAATLHRPHVVLLDIGARGIDGHEVCRQIRAQPWGRSIKIVAVTARAREEALRQPGEACFDMHLAKPVTVAALVPLLYAD